MTTPEDIIAALRAQLFAVPGLPSIVLPNEEVPRAAPYAIFDDGFEAVSTITIDGEERYLLQPQVSFMVEHGTKPQAYTPFVAALRQAFKIGTKINDGAADIAYVLRSPTSFGGRPDNGLYRVDIALQIAGDVTL